MKKHRPAATATSPSVLADRGAEAMRLGSVQAGDGVVQATGQAGSAAAMDPSSRRCLCRSRPGPGRQGHVQGSRDRPREHPGARRDGPRAGAVPDLPDPSGPAPESGTGGVAVYRQRPGSGRDRSGRRIDGGPLAGRAGNGGGAGRQTAERRGLGRTEPGDQGGPRRLGPGQVVRGGRGAACPCPAALTIRAAAR